MGYFFAGIVVGLLIAMIVATVVWFVIKKELKNLKDENPKSS